MNTKETIRVHAEIHAPVDEVWRFYTKPEHIVQWNNASDDWHTPRAENDLRIGGTFVSRMEAKDGSAGFDFTGTYIDVKPNALIVYAIADGRKVTVTFTENLTETNVSVVFEAEDTHPVKMQRGGWQAILDNFKSYVEEKTG